MATTQELEAAAARKRDQQRRDKTCTAWRRYLDDTQAARNRGSDVYQDTEPHCWARLQSELRRIPGGAWPGVVGSRRKR